MAAQGGWQGELLLDEEAFNVQKVTTGRRSPKITRSGPATPTSSDYRLNTVPEHRNASPTSSLGESPSGSFLEIARAQTSTRGRSSSANDVDISRATAEMDNSSRPRSALGLLFGSIVRSKSPIVTRSKSVSPPHVCACSSERTQDVLVDIDEQAGSCGAGKSCCTPSGGRSTPLTLRRRKKSPKAAKWERSAALTAGPSIEIHMVSCESPTQLSRPTADLIDLN